MQIIIDHQDIQIGHQVTGVDHTVDHLLAEVVVHIAGVVDHPDHQDTDNNFCYNINIKIYEDLKWQY